MNNDRIGLIMRCSVNLRLISLAAETSINKDELGNKTGKHFPKIGDCKQILRDLISRLIPSDIIQVKNQALSPPDSRWCNSDSIEFEKLSPLRGRSRTDDYLCERTVLSPVNECLCGHQNWRLPIWLMLNVNAWMESAT